MPKPAAKPAVKSSSRAAVHAPLAHTPLKKAVFKKAIAASAKASAQGIVHLARKAKRHWDNDLFARPEKGAYKRLFRMRVTAYTPISEGMEGGRWTATSRDGRSAHGVAVDPRLIPLGTRLWVPGYGHAIADDTGGMIRGHRLDIRLQDRSGMSRWGVRSLPVYVLSEP